MNLSNISKQSEVQDLVQRALAEDIGLGDVTCMAVIPDDPPMISAVIISKGTYVISGGSIAESVFTQVDPTIKVPFLVNDGKNISKNEVILKVVGPAHHILTAERTALNFLQRMTGIATLTKKYVEKMKAYETKILDTRKTAPTLRILEKYAVQCGGGENHRMGLYDRVMIKDNHMIVGGHKEELLMGLLSKAIKHARKAFPELAIEIEIDTVIQLEPILRLNPDWVLLDNMSISELTECVMLNNGQCKLEASGDITLQTVEEIASTGVDAISVGALTHSAPAASLSLECKGL
ncbi:MAG: carboxylating nicotinate-nucleotide diphosphorylase [Kiritimatiellae bacterium]|nr:carboxylating nicotinate-nucleotide diphosphorylase [Kiritimatiellia bacterium]